MLCVTCLSMVHVCWVGCMQVIYNCNGKHQLYKAISQRQLFVRPIKGFGCNAVRDMLFAHGEGSRVNAQDAASEKWQQRARQLCCTAKSPGYGLGCNNNGKRDFRGWKKKSQFLLHSAYAAILHTARCNTLFIGTWSSSSLNASLRLKRVPSPKTC